MVGGWNDTSGALNSVDAYDPVTDTWTAKAAMPTARIGLAVGVLNGTLYALGGDSYSTGYVDTVEAYDPATDSWTTQAPLFTPCAYLGAGVAGGKLWAVGGIDSYFHVLDLQEMYNRGPTGEDSWEPAGRMPTARAYLGVGVVNDELYAVGGETPTIVNTVEAYDPATFTWTTKAPMPTARMGPGVGVVNGELYAVGGFGDVAPLNTVEAFKP